MKPVSLLFLSSVFACGQTGRTPDAVAYNVTVAAQVRSGVVPTNDAQFPMQDGIVADLPRPPIGKVLRIDTLTLRQLGGPGSGPLCGIYNTPDTFFMETTPSGASSPRVVHFPLKYEAISIFPYGNPGMFRVSPGPYIEGTSSIFRIAAGAPCVGSSIEITVSGLLFDSGAVTQGLTKSGSISSYQVTVTETPNSVALGGGKTYLTFPLPPAGKVLGVEQVWVRHIDGPINTDMQYCQAEIGTPGLRSPVSLVGFPAPTVFHKGQTITSSTPFYVSATAGSFRIACGDTGLLGTLTATVTGTLYDQGK